MQSTINSLDNVLISDSKPLSELMSKPSPNKLFHWSPFSQVFPEFSTFFFKGNLERIEKTSQASFPKFLFIYLTDSIQVLVQVPVLADFFTVPHKIHIGLPSGLLSIACLYHFRTSNVLSNRRRVVSPKKLSKCFPFL